MIKSTISEIGEFSYFEDEPIIILFNDLAPEGLREVCIIHNFEEKPEGDLLKVGSKIIFGEKEYEVVEIGHTANKTLRELGHASFYFDLDEGSELLPGSVSLSPHVLPLLNVGDSISFIY
ncbi:PTS glucitol/sorbitol transporter subunit IIA [Vagococcus lutrae]|uniref:PTS glucitol/sorbitol transporter subunit IIA n=1 Tax=Vagococcus lutrae TaxID=81947 RepID=UPI001C943198|nr:PTS glucitol/sorbitol transporter subunit IIA [Vagococcus lutrae]QZN88159.1 PTS glucitol/sorbitol transporter subunit IIA [Vagococcus lutrae]